LSRIRKYYERRFRELLAKNSQSMTNDVNETFAAAQRLATAENIKADMALAIIHADLRREAENTAAFPQRFFCDVGLGGLTRWLRGAGYEAHWKRDLDDAAVIRETKAIDATLITTDSLMTERGVLRDGHLPWVWVPSSLTCEEQLTLVLRELALPLLASRCMQCGGSLKAVSKAEVIHRIPPRTAIWLEDYFLCTACDQVFWRGTHWQRINRELHRLSQSSQSFAPL
jgi:uncharacterized protein with PIN domain